MRRTTFEKRSAFKMYLDRQKLSDKYIKERKAAHKANIKSVEKTAKLFHACGLLMAEKARRMELQKT